MKQNLITLMTNDTSYFFENGVPEESLCLDGLDDDEKEQFSSLTDSQKQNKLADIAYDLIDSSIADAFNDIRYSSELRHKRVVLMKDSIYQRWDGAHQTSSALFNDLDDALQTILFNGDDKTFTVYFDIESGDVIVTWSDHDTPMGGTELHFRLFNKVKEPWDYDERNIPLEDTAPFKKEWLIK